MTAAGAKMRALSAGRLVILKSGDGDEAAQAQLAGRRRPERLRR